MCAKNAGCILSPNLKDRQVLHGIRRQPMCGNFGYRHQKPNGRFIFRIGFTPLYELDGKELHPSGGLSFGYSF